MRKNILLCYAVQIDQCYFPVEDSHFNNKDKDISYDRPIFGSGKKSMELYLKYNHWAKGKYPQLKPQRVFKKRWFSSCICVKWLNVLFSANKRAA
jgi:hypothetical protein